MIATCLHYPERQRQAKSSSENWTKRGDPFFNAWDEEASMIMVWLRNSVTLEINDTCMFLSSTKAI